MRTLPFRLGVLLTGVAISAAHAQEPRTALDTAGPVSAFALVADQRPDFDAAHALGATVGLDYDWRRSAGLDLRGLDLRTDTGIDLSGLLAGPKLGLHAGRFAPYATGGGGLMRCSIYHGQLLFTHPALFLAAGADVRLTTRVSARAPSLRSQFRVRTLRRFAPRTRSIEEHALSDLDLPVVGRPELTALKAALRPPEKRPGRAIDHAGHARRTRTAARRGRSLLRGRGAGAEGGDGR